MSCPPRVGPTVCERVPRRRPTPRTQPDAPDAPTALLGAIGVPDRDGRLPVEVVVDGWRFEFVVEDAARADLRERATRDRVGAGIGGGSFEIRAIIPGRVVAVVVAPGDTVEAGEPLLVVEAMKMQNELRAPRAGSVVRVAVGVGATVDVGDVLVVLG